MATKSLSNGSTSFADGVLTYRDSINIADKVLTELHDCWREEVESKQIKIKSGRLQSIKLMQKMSRLYIQGRLNRVQS